MKKYLLLTFTLFFITISIQAQDYFWVGNGGNWTDVSHWATTSGGATTHATPPTETNDIYFDANSFSENNQEVILDADSAKCKSLDFSSVTNSPEFNFADYYYKIFIHGNFTIVNDMQWGFQHTYLVGNSIEISTNGVWTPSNFYIYPSNENTSVELKSDFNPTGIEVWTGNFKTNNNNIEGFNIKFGSTGSISGNSTINLGSSTITTGRFVTYSTNSTFNAGTSQINIEEGTSNSSVLFFGGGNDFHYVTFSGVIDRIKDNNTFNKFTVLPGSELSFEDGETQTADEFSFGGTSANPISILSRNDGEAATLSQASGTVNGNYLILKDNIATGGATFNAGNSTDLGNVSGWNIEVTAPEDYYWVGNSGDWSDVNHWAKTSGGSNMHIDLPTAIDDVYFDANSFSNGTSTVNIDPELVFVNNIFSEGTNTGTTIRATNTTMSSINVYGTIQLGSGVTYRFGEIHFLSDENEDIESNGSFWGTASELFFEGEGTYNIVDNFDGNDISIRGGTFNSNGHSFILDKFDVTPLNDPTVNLDNSVIDCQAWFPSTIDEISLNNTEIYCFFQFYGRGHDYKKVVYGSGPGNIWVYGNFYAETLEFKPGSNIQILPGDTVYFENLIANGTSSDPITIESRTPGEHAYLSKSSGTVTCEYLEINDNYAIGGATFIANNSELSDNVFGWNGIVSVYTQNLIDFAIYPNPSSDYLKIDLNSNIIANYPTGIDIYLYALDGKLALKNQVMPSNKIDLSNLANGLYNAVLTDGKSILYREKVVIQ